MKKTSHSDPNLPPNVLQTIVQKAGEHGPRGLKNFLLAGRTGRDLCLAPESLKSLRLDKTYAFPKCSKLKSPFFSLFCKCLKANNPYALNVVAIRLVFKHNELEAALYILKDIKNVFPHAKILYVILNFCAGNNCEDVEGECRKQFQMFEVRNIGVDIETHIKTIGPRRLNSFFPTFNVEHYPTCGEVHEYFDEYEDQRCEECIYFYLARDICKLS